MPYRANRADILSGRLTLNWAIQGNLMNDATQSGFEGISKTLELDLPPISRSDGGMEPYYDAGEVKIKVEEYQNNYPAIKRNLLRCQNILDVVVEHDSVWYNLVGANALAMEFDLDISSTDIIQTVNYHGKVISLASMQALMDASTGAFTGGTGGLSITGLTGGFFDDAEYEPPHLQGIYFGTGSLAGLTISNYADTLSGYDELGEKEAAGTKFKMSVVKIGDSLNLNPITKRVEFKCTTAIFNNTPARIKATSATSNTELNWVWVFDSFIIVVAKCMKYVGGPALKDASGLVVGKLEGSTFLDAVNAAQSRVVFNDSGHVITFNPQGKVFS